MSLIYRFKFFK